MIMESVEQCSSCIGDLSATKDDFLGLKDLLPPSLISKCHVCSFNSSSWGFYSNFRLPLTTVEEVKEFVTTVKEKSFVTWRIQRTDPFKMSAGCKNLFWAQYRCQSSSNRVSKNTINPHTKHTNCRAKMVITLKRTLVERSRTKDPHMPKYPTIVNIRHEHNHPLSSAEALRFRDVSSETTQKFKCLLQSGYSVASAMKLHKIDLQWEYGENYFQIIADRSICPDTGWAHRLCDRLFRNVAKRTKEPFVQDLKKKLDEINKGRDVLLAKMEQIDSQIVVAICTPLMHCVHRLLPQSAEVVFMDTSGVVDRHKHRIYIILTYSHAGGLPLGIIITTSEREQLIMRGLLMIQSLVGKDAFYGRSGCAPAIFMTNDSLVQQKAVANCFPETTCLLGISHILKDMWHWLCDAEHEILLPDRPPLMNIVNSLAHACNEEDLVSCYIAACLDVTALKYPHFMHHVTRAWDRRQQWAVALCPNQILESNRTNIASAVLRGMKDTIIHRLKAFSITQLLDVIFTRLDRYYCHRIVDVTSNRCDRAVWLQYMPFENIADVFEIKQLSEELFEVVSEKLNEVHQVNATIGCCSCRMGITGAPCKHQYSVAKKCDISSFSFCVTSNLGHEDVLLKIIAECENLSAATKQETSAEVPKEVEDANLILPVLHPVDSVKYENVTENHSESAADTMNNVKQLELQNHELEDSKFVVSVLHSIDSPRCGNATENHSETVIESVNGDDDSQIKNNNCDFESDSNCKDDQTNEYIENCKTADSSKMVDCLTGLKKFYEEISYKITTQSEIYQSAVEVFLENYSSLCTDTARISALKTFGKDFSEVNSEQKLADSSTVQEKCGMKDDTCLQMTKSQKISSVTQLEYHTKRIRTEDRLFPDQVAPPR